MMSRELRNEKIARFHTGIFFRRFPSRYRWKAAEWEDDGTRERKVYVCVLRPLVPSAALTDGQMDRGRGREREMREGSVV